MTQALCLRSVPGPLAVYRGEPVALTFAGYPRSTRGEVCCDDDIRDQSGQR
jgi:hypothetical protein